MAKLITLKRSLFIGLGGTGASALLHTKKRFLDTYGEVPPMISFLSIDTDFNTQTKSIERDNVLKGHKITDHEVYFTKSELIYTSVRGAEQAYERQKSSIFDWMPPQNEHVLRTMTNGAGQVRSNGRFALHFNYQQIINSVTNKINELLNINLSQNSRYQSKGTDIEINFVFSVGGGTGSGTFIDIAYLVKEAIGTANNTTSIAFIVLPDIFNTMQSGPSMQNVKPNGFGALKDLDFLMRKDIHKLNLSLEYQNKTIPIISNPFDIVFTVNNKNTIGETVSDIKEISEQIGLAMYTGASELSANINSAYDNVLSVLSGGVLDIANKKAWAGGMGVSELFYDGNTLGNIYARKAISSMIINLITQDNVSTDLADSFIDSKEIAIRENDGNDYLIDSLLPKNPTSQFPELSSVDEYDTISQYINSQLDYSKSQITANYNNKYKTVSIGLKNKVLKVINTDSGVANTGEFLTSLDKQLNIFLNEMKDEEKEFKEKLKRLTDQIESEKNSLSEITGLSSMFKKSEIKDRKGDITQYVNEQAIVQNEILRRQFAQKFLNSLIDEVTKYKKNVDIIYNRLLTVKNLASGQAANLQNNVNSERKTFIIDLHKEEINKILVEESDYVITDFINTLAGSNKLYDFYSFSDANVIEDYFWNYTKNLNKALEYRNRNIEDIISKLQESKKEEITKQLILKSNALWSYDLKGFKVGSSIHEDFVIGLPSTNSTIIDSFNTLINAQNISFVNTGISNRITCYKMEMAVPIYAVNDISGYEKDYKISNINHHIDDNWLTKMDRENFSIWPEEKEDHSLESWVIGLVYKFIKFSDGKYQIQSKKKGIPRKDYWIELSEYRDDAFDLFVKEDYVSEMIDLVEEKRKQLGDEATKELLSDVIENYYRKYSQINLSDEELDKKEYSKIAELLDKEIDFTDKELPKML